MTGYPTNCLSCTIGGVAPDSATFQLLDYGVVEKGVLSNGFRVGSDVEVTCRAVVQADTQANFSAALGAVAQFLRADRNDFIVKGVGGGTEFTLLAAVCADGGPHYESTLEAASGNDEAGIYRREFTFKVTGKTANGDSSNTPISSFKETIDTAPGGERVVTREGQFYSALTTLNYAQVLSEFKAAYPYPSWVVATKKETESPSSIVSYTLTAVEVLYPFDSPGIVDGEGSYRKDRDEQQRMTETWQFDLVTGEDAQTVYDQLRQYVTQDPEKIVRESLEYTLYRSNRTRMTFVVLGSASSDDLLEYSQKIRWVDNPATYRQITYPGAQPLLIQQDETYREIVQSGTATAIKKYLIAPDPLYPNALAEKPFKDWENVDLATRRVTWSYRMFVMGADGGTDIGDGGFNKDFQADVLERLQGPTFEGGGA